MLQPLSVRIGVAGFIAVTAALVDASPAPTVPSALAGWPLYDRLCLACHGARGDGRGPASPYSWGRPNAFSRGEYEWRSTPIGQPPTDDDLRATISYGAPGSSMPSFADVLTHAEIDQ